MKLSKAEMKRINEQHGYDYFDKDNASFFGSYIHSSCDEHQLFIESIDDFYKEERLYMVKAMGLDGNIITVEPENIEDTSMHFPTLEMAEKFREDFGRLMGDDFKDIQHCGFTYDKGVFKFVNKEGKERTISANEMLENGDYPLVAMQGIYDLEVTCDIPETMGDLTALDTEDYAGFLEAALDKMDSGHASINSRRTYRESNAEYIHPDDADKEPFVRAQVYGRIFLYECGYTEWECRDKLKDKLIATDLGVFNDKTLDYTVELNTIKSDAEAVIKRLNEKIGGLEEPCDIVETSSEFSDYIIVCSVDEPSVDSLDLILYEKGENIPAFAIPDSIEELFEDASLIGVLKDISKDEMARALRGLALGGKNREKVLEKMKNEHSPLTRRSREEKERD